MDQFGEVLDNVSLFDAATGAWVHAYPLIHPRHQHVATVLSGCSAFLLPRPTSQSALADLSWLY